MIQENETFTKVNFTASKLLKQYDCCIFIDCNFENVPLLTITFIECEFINCNLSNAKMSSTAFKTVAFDRCKLLGISFSDCNPFLLKFSFKACDLTLSSFYQLKIKNTSFSHCNLSEVDFTETDLTHSKFDRSDLSKAIFENSNLEKVDFSSASNFIINPEINNVKKASFSKENIEGLFQHLQIIIQ
jgi:uncharacterized protein YjbI with pentapeptide repeats